MDDLGPVQRLAPAQLAPAPLAPAPWATAPQLAPFAPHPNFDGIADTSDILGECRKGDVLCSKISVSDNQILTTMWIAAVVGVACFLIFCVLRTYIKTYTTRLHLGSVWIEPPAINTKGIQKLWSWVWVIVTTSDAEVIQSCGMDALIFSRILTMGVTIFFAATLLSSIIVIPVVTTSHRVEMEHARNTTVQVSTFNKLTASNITEGSNLYWVLVVYLFVLTGVICFILAVYYKANVILRQRYMATGEAGMNEWNTKDIWENPDEPDMPTVGQAIASAVNNLVNPHAQMYVGREDLAEAAAREAGNWRRSETGDDDEYGRLTGGWGGHNSFRNSSNPIYTNPDLQLKPELLRPMTNHTFGNSRRASGSGEKSATDEPQRTPGHRRRNSELRREVLSVMGMLPCHEIREAQKIIEAHQLKPQPPRPHSRMAQSLNFAKSTMPGMSKPADSDDAGNPLEIVVVDEKPTGPSYDGKYGSLVSKYERDAPAYEKRPTFPKWWETATKTKQQQPGESGKPGKPNISFQKVTYAQTPDGKEDPGFLVNAQNYAVLVTDVPDIAKGRKRRTKREKRRGFKWTLWYRFLGIVNNVFLMRKDKDRKTGDLIIPTNKYMTDTPLTARTRKNSVADGDSSHSSPRKAGVPDNRERTISWTEMAINPESRCSNPGDDNPLSVESKGLPELSIDIEQPFEQQFINSLSDLLSPLSHNNAQALEEAPSESEAPESEEGEMQDAQTLVSQTFGLLWPKTFDGVIPIRNHKALDLVIEACNYAIQELQLAEAKYRLSGETIRPMGYPHRGTLWNPINWFRRGCQEDLIDFWAKEVRRLEMKIEVVKREVASQRPRTSFFVLFTSQKDATMAAQSKIHSESGISFKTQAAPGPEEVNWQALWTPWIWREVRGVISLVMVAAILLFPIGLFSGGLNQLTAAICNQNPQNRFFDNNFCKKSSLSRSLVTGLAPPLALMIYQFGIMPTLLYRIAQFQRSSYSLSQLDRKIGMMFFVYDVFNVFLGGMLGGSIFGQFGVLWKNPERLPGVLGSAVPAASNFFINYVIVQAFVSQSARLIIPHFGVFPAFWRALGFRKPRTPIENFQALSVHSIRYGREIGSVMLIYLISLVYGTVSPIILPFALVYSIGAWIYWRYNILYVNERCYESGGRIWELTFQCMMWVLFIAELFTGTVMLANKAYPQAAVLWVIMTPLLYKFARFCETRYASAIRHMPLEVAATQPSASVEPWMYLPPALRAGNHGWYPETGKAWENFGMPRYGIEWPGKKPS